MLYNLKVKNNKGELLDIDAFNPMASGYAIASVEGLGPVDANISTIEGAVSDGSYFTSARVSERVITLGLIFYEGRKSIEELRLDTYKYFPNKTKVTLYFKTENREAYIEGFVQQNLPSIFTNKASATIAIKCPNPYFKSLKEKTVIFSGLSGGFTFPFDTSESTGDYLMFSELALNINKNIQYHGENPIGVTVELNFKGSVQQLQIIKSETNQRIWIDTDKLKNKLGTTIIAGDKIIITTEIGNKTVKLYRQGQEINILNCLGPNIGWFELTYGSNNFAYAAELGREFVEMKVQALAELYVGL